MLYDPKWEQETRLEPWRQTLLDAANLIDRFGHAKKTLVDGKGGMCILGAVAMAKTGSPLSWKFEFMEVIDNLLANSPAIRSESTWDVCHWNNHPDRTKEEVVNELRRVALA